MEVLVVSSERAGLELDEFLCLERPLFNKGFFRRNIRAGLITVDGQAALPNLRLKEGDVVMFDLDEIEELGGLPSAPAAPELALEVLYEDENVLAVDKPAGVASEPERWAPEEGCMAGALLRLVLERAGGGDLDFRPRLLHRLDKGTSGVLVAAKNLEAERILRAAFENGDVHKTYLALVEGEMPDPPGTPGDPEDPDAGFLVLDGDIGAAEELPRRDRKRLAKAIGGRRAANRMAVLERGGKPARTRVAVHTRYHGFSMVEAHPETGRTHQIRVHLSHAGFPLAVDSLYGRRDALLLSELKRKYRAKPGRPERPLLDRLSLHAAAIDLPDPAVPQEAGQTGGRRLVIEAPLPADFQRITRQLAKVRPQRR